jgi:hypothetical protein
LITLPDDSFVLVPRLVSKESSPCSGREEFRKPPFKCNNRDFSFRVFMAFQETRKVAWKRFRKEKQKESKNITHDNNRTFLAQNTSSFSQILR